MGRLRKRTRPIHDSDDENDKVTRDKINTLLDNEDIEDQTREVIHAIQEELQKAQEKTLQTKQQLYDIETRSRSRRRIEKKTDEDETVDTAGHRFAVMTQPWIKNPALLSLDPSETPKPTDKALIEEYREALPESVQERAKERIVGDIFLKAVSDIRSTLVNRMRTCKAHHIFPRRIAMAKTIDPDPDILKAFCGYNASTNKYDTFGPFILADGDGPLLSRIFVPDHLPKTLRLCLFGPNSVKPDGSGKSGGCKTYGVLWNVRKVTPGSMAWAAILCRYWASLDVGKDFTMIGKVTDINYYADFIKIRDIARRRWHMASFKAIVANWNKIIFGDRDDDDAPRPAQSREDYDELMREMEEDDEEPEVEDDLPGASLYVVKSFMPTNSLI
ncbi:hypothetical protein SISNIDRAFT_492073 [Sistotremastrum niveocremeum HHB9708]|uniref:Uncharacterized protein n=1 Tax=Sistotremastrum niveocremeum HHB9708 TaxID=1314777 RepID=A0A164M3D7_9AGAM|nr:hypothetical protein SISNIDRAFT_492073 [Sistotremastrum niveocremeum HHB9708]